MTTRGTITVLAKEIDVEGIRGQVLELLKHLDVKKGVLSQKDITEICVHEHKKVEGPTKALVAVVSLAVTLATMGTGAELGAGLVSLTEMSGASATFVSGMTQGAFTALCSRSAVSLLENRGNVGHVLNDITSKESLRDFGISALTSGLTQGLSEKLGIQTKAPDLAKITKVDFMKGCLGHLKSQMLKEGVSLGVRTTVGHEKLKHTIKSSLQHITSGTIGGVFSNVVGDLYGEEKLDYLSHKLSHAFIGGVEGAILGDMKAGAAAAVIAETLAETLTPTDLLHHDNPLQTLQNIADISKVMTASILLALGEENMDVVIATATNAVENNFLVSKLPLIGPLFKLLKVDDESSDVEELKQFLLRYTDIDLDGDVTDEAITKYWGGKLEEFKQLPKELKQLAIFIAQDPVAAGKVFKEMGIQKLAEFSDLVAHDPETAMDDLIVEGAKFVALTKGLSSLSKAIRGTRVVEDGVKIVVVDSPVVEKVLGVESKLAQGGVHELEQQFKQFWTQERTYTLRGQTNKVYQRPDLIDPFKVDKYGKTNLERMQNGLCPYSNSGQKIELHHMIQTQVGGLAEVPSLFHDKYSKIIHINPSTIPSGINRPEFDAWRRLYWIERAKDFIK